MKAVQVFLMSPPIFHRLSTRPPAGIDASATARRTRMLGRREFLYGLGITIGGGALLGSGLSARADDGWSERLVRSLAALEQERGGRLGVAVADTLDGRRAAYRGDERFP